MFGFSRVTVDPQVLGGKACIKGLGTSCKPRPYVCLLVLLGIVLLLAYRQLSDAQKRLVKNSLRQVPYLPFRYSV